MPHERRFPVTRVLPVLLVAIAGRIGVAHAEPPSAGTTAVLGAERCGAGESPLFACGYDNKIVSVCAGRGTVTYRFGTLRSTEMTITSDGHDRAAFASEVSGQGSGGHQSNLRFTGGGYSYVVSSGQAGSLAVHPGSTMDALDVAKGHQDIASHECSPIGDDRLFEAHVPGDPDPWFVRW